MQKEPDPEQLAKCMDGIGAEIEDAPSRPKRVDNRVASRQYSVRYIIPTVSGNKEKNMRVAGNSAEDAVKACKAAHPDADIESVD